MLKLPSLLSVIGIIYLLVSHFLQFVLIQLNPSTSASSGLIITLAAGVILGLLGSFIVQKRPVIGGSLLIVTGSLMLIPALFTLIYLLLNRGLSSGFSAVLVFFVIGWGVCGLLHVTGGTIAVVNPGKIADARAPRINSRLPNSDKSSWPPVS